LFGTNRTILVRNYTAAHHGRGNKQARRCVSKGDPN
jgi:hypothetical protein